MADITRSAAELDKLEFNYYEAYQIPVEETDAEVIKKKINNLCTIKANSSNPIDVRIGKELKQDTLEVMGNPALRATELANYKRLHLERIRQFIVSLCARGVVNKSELQQIAQKNKLDFAELEKELKPLLSGVKYIDDTQKIFDFSTYENLEKFLKLYKDGAYSNLFEMMGVPMTCSATEGKTKLGELKTREGAEAQKKTPAGIALKSIFGEAGRIFNGDDEKLKGYKKFIQIKESVYNPIKARKDNGLTTVTQDEYLEFIQLIARDTKGSMQAAEQDLAAILKFNAIKLLGDGDLGGKTIEICPYPDCGKPYLATKGMKACPHCGRSFEIVCWNCKGSMPMTKNAAACPHCGVTEKAQQPFLNEVKAVDLVLRNPKSSLPELKSALAKLVAVVPSYGRVATSETAKKVAFYNAEIAKKEKVEQESVKIFRDGIAEIDKQIALKMFRKAEALLIDLKKAVPGFNDGEINNYQTKISAEMAKSDNLASLAKRYLSSGDEAMAMENAGKALEICADNTEAQQILRKSPPKAPLSVACKVKDEKIVNVEWNIPAGQKMVTYTVVRKAGGKPTSITDGTIIAKELTLNFYEDSSLAPATPYYYGVFAERYGVQSTLALNAESVKVFPDITDCKQDMTEGVIKVNWTCPTGVSQVVVKKNKGAAMPSATTGSTVQVQNNTGFTDTDCDSTGCSYLIYCEYKCEGGIKASKGVQVFFKPYSIPKAVTGAKISRIEKGEFAISGANLARSTKLYLFDSKPDLRLNKAEKIQLLKDVSASATVLDVDVDQHGGFYFRVPLGRTGYIYPINVNEQLYVAGEPTLITTSQGVSNITYSEYAGNITINFNIEPTVMQVTAKVNNQKFVKSLTDEGMEYTFSADTITRKGGMVFKLQEDAISYITLFAYVGDKKENAVCIPIDLPDTVDFRKKQMVKYSLSFEANPSKSFVVNVKFEAEMAITLPTFVLVKGNPRPMNKNAGEKLVEIPPIELKKGLFTHGKFVGKASVKVPPMARFAKLAMFIAEDGIKNVQMKEVNNI